MGRHLVACLRSNGARVRVLSRYPAHQARDYYANAQRVEIVQGDFREPSAVRRALAGVDTVFHLAGAKRKVEEFAPVNIEGTRTILNASVTGNVQRFVHLSSVGVIGRGPNEVVLDEAPCNPQNEYERTKYVAEQLVLQYHRDEGLPITVIRPANVFGDLDQEKQLLTLIRLIKSNRFWFVGDGAAMLNYVYVGDVAEACRMISVTPGSVGEVYNVSDPCSLGEFVGFVANELGVVMPRRRVPTSIAYAAATVCDLLSPLLGRPLPLTLNKVHAARSKRVYSASKLRQEYPGWPPVGWREGIRRTIAWYRAQQIL